MNDEMSAPPHRAPTVQGAHDDVHVAGVAVPRLPAELRSTMAVERLAATADLDALRRLAVITACGVLSLAMAVALDHPLTWLLHAVTGGIVLTSLIAAEHEALHGSVFSAPFANHLVGTLAGALCLTPYSAYRTYHLRHHQYTHVEEDAEPIVVLRSRGALAAALLLSTLGLALSLWTRLFRSLAGRADESERRLRRPMLDATSLVAGVAVVTLVGLLVAWQGPTSVLLIYGAPLAVYFVLSAASFLPEHYECDYGPGPAWSTTRTTPSNALARFVLWNANLHTAHHLVPAVPCRSLPRLHELIEARCEHLESGYLSYYRGLWGRIGRGELAQDPPWSR